MFKGQPELSIPKIKDHDTSVEKRKLVFLTSGTWGIIIV